MRNETIHQHVYPGLDVFPTRLGWMALLSCNKTVLRLCFGHRSAAAAVGGLQMPEVVRVATDAGNSSLAARLKAYAEGAADDFTDVVCDHSGARPFSRLVIENCRKIPYGQVATYAEIAARAGSPAAARAVGNVMAGNRYPIIVPCHRVVAAEGRRVRFSAPGGHVTRQRLLDLERQALQTPFPTTPSSPMAARHRRSGVAVAALG